MSEAERGFTHLVAIGSSAGGIESLSVLVASLPADFPAPIVIAQHLHPNRASALGDILARRGPLTVRTIEHRNALEPGVIYVVPPHRNVRITDQEVSVVADGDGPQPSIDVLFTSAADAFGENLIAVVLSGTGSDGAAGARDVKYAGGTIVIENPETAAYPGMPLSLAPSSVDIVANRERIGDLLVQLVSGEFVVPPPSEQTHLNTFLQELREESGIDFSAYKQPTIQRRLQRRLLATNQTSIADYVRHMHQNPGERQRLINSFLIKVTEFFRDPEVFKALREQVLPELVQDAINHGGDLRIWSAGCATGEEAYSLAMALAEVLGDQLADLNVRIFATDLDEEAVTFARRGLYPARALANLPPDMLNRYFSEYGDDYEVRKQLRGMLVFGGHDLGQRAPFPRIDLIFCRNVLIYFTPALQRRTLQLFAFSLRSGGYLVLGKSETVSPLAEYFAVDQPRLKIFRRVGDRALIPPSRIQDALPATTLPAARPPGVLPSVRTQRSPRDVVRGRASTWVADQLLLALPVGVVVVDHNYDIHSINSEARRLFGIHSTAVEHDLIHQIQHFDAAEVRRAIDQAIAAGAPVMDLVGSIDPPPEARRILELTAAPIVRTEGGGETFVSVTAVDVSEREQLREQQVGAAEVLHRLTRANEEVLVANQELTGTIAKFRAENEELVVASEEIQAATEEVETLNEELQASNEELETLNEELQATVEELNTTNDDLQARTVELQTIALDGETTRQRLRSIVDGIDGAVMVLDVKGGIDLHNAAWDRLEIPSTFDILAVDEHGEPLAAESLPPAHAIRGERLARTMGLDRPGHRRTWFHVTGNPTVTDAHEHLLIVTMREVDAPAG